MNGRTFDPFERTSENPNPQTSTQSNMPTEVTQQNSPQTSAQTRVTVSGSTNQPIPGQCADKTPKFARIVF